jgi:DNA-binding transcriptional MerR regulator
MATESPDSSTARAAAHDRARMNIGEVLELLRDDFPSISIPKIRFLEEKGIVTPERTSAGYRKFSHADVERLRYALLLQRDHHQPLARIVEILDAIDRGLEPPPLVDLTPTVPEVALAADGLPSPESFRRHDDLRLSRRELVKVADISEELLEQLEQFGLVKARRGTGHYDSDDLVICTTARELADFGLEPRHLRAFKTAADREVGLVEQVLAPQRRATDPAASARREDTVSQLAALSVRMHATLVKAGLSRL